jgi:polysaccharide transporter, PST family
MKSPFKNILRLSAGDFVARVLYFVAFIHMAKVLGVAVYGVLEFAIAVRTYLLLLGDGGIEIWATRETARGVDVRSLSARVIPVRFLLSAGMYLLVTGALALTPDNPNLHRILPLFALTAVVQSLNLKWAFMGHERMTSVALGLVCSQIVFASAVFLTVRDPDDLIRVPVAWLASEVILVVFFWRAFVRAHGELNLPSLRGTAAMVRSAVTLGTAHGLALMNYNLDSLLLGVMLGPGPVGWYAAAYKPITAILAMPVSYFIGLLPSLSAAWIVDHKHFRSILGRSVRLTAIFAMPVGIGGTLLAAPIIDFLFGHTYASSVPALQIISWSAVLVILRGNWRQALNAAGQQRLDLFCAATAVAANIVLNLLWIPQYRLIGAASATLCSEIVWFAVSAALVRKYVVWLPLAKLIWKSGVAAGAMAMILLVSTDLQWILRAAIAAAAYFAVLALLGEREILARIPVFGSTRGSAAAASRRAETHVG